MALTDIKIMTAKRIAEQNGLNGVIIFAFNEDGSNFVSYGRSIRGCKQLGKLIDFVANTVESGRFQLDGAYYARREPAAADLFSR